MINASDAQNPVFYEWESGDEDEEQGREMVG